MPDVIKNRYRSLRKHQENKLYLAFIGEDIKKNNAPIIIKRYQLESFSAALRQKLLEAIDQLAELNHPNIVPIIDYYDDQRFFYVISPYFQEQSLESILAHIKNFSLDNALAMIEELDRAVQYAHHKKIVHGTINETNVLLLKDGRVKLQGFLIDDLINAALLAKNIIVVNAAYLAPEQIRGKPTDPQSDVFGLGAVFYKMLTGAPPFVGGQNTVRLMKNLSAAPVRPSLLNPDIPKDIEEIILKSLQKDSKLRYASPLEFWRDLELGKVSVSVAELKKRKKYSKVQSASIGLPSFSERRGNNMEKPNFKKIKKPFKQSWQYVTQHRQVKKAADKVVQGVGQVVSKIDDFVNEEKGSPVYKKPKTFKEKFFIFAVVGLMSGIVFASLQAFIFFYFTSMPKIEVPNLYSKSLADAVELLEARGLRFKIAGSSYSADVPPEHVYLQIPEAGRIVKKKRPVKIFLSKGVGEINVPALIGQNINQLDAIAERLKIKFAVSEELWRNNAAHGEILSQDPEAGVVVNYGATINLTVSKGFPVLVTLKDESEREKIVLVTMIVPEDWLPQKVKIISDGPYGQRTVYEKEIFPGQTEHTQIIESKDAVLSIFYNEELSYKKELRSLRHD